MDFCPKDAPAHVGGGHGLSPRRTDLDALHKVLDHGVLGYELPGRFYRRPLPRLQRLYNWKVKPEAVLTVTGIVGGFTAAARAFCLPKKAWRSKPLFITSFTK